MGSQCYETVYVLALSPCFFLFVYRIVGNFRGSKIQFVVYIFVVAACTAGKEGR